VSGTYTINVQSNELRITQFGGTEINELYDGQRYVDAVNNVKSYSFLNNELKLYYGENNEYLIFHVRGEYPIDIPIINVPFIAWHYTCLINLKPDTIYLFNSHEELLAHYFCTGPVLPDDDLTLPAFDFDNYSLIVFFDSICIAGSGVQNLLFQQTAESKYELYFDAYPSIFDYNGPLFIGLLVPKLQQDVQLKLNINYIYTGFYERN
jgi:hypothetical protein